MEDIKAIDEYTFQHSVNVCVLSVLTGITLGNTRDRLRSNVAEKKIHEFSRIVGIIDTYDAVTSKRGYRKAIAPNEAYEFISGFPMIRFAARGCFLTAGEGITRNYVE